MSTSHKRLRGREWAGSDLPEAREEDVDSQGTGSSSFHQGVLAVVQAKQQSDTQDLLVTLQRGAAVTTTGGLRRALPHRDTPILSKTLDLKELPLRACSR